MYARLIEKLHLDAEPVGIYFGNETIRCDVDASPGKRNCVMPFLLASARGRSVSMNEDSCNCAGGATGCCFGDGFARLNPRIDVMLAQGFGDEAKAGMPEIMVEGERFFDCAETTRRWRESLPISDRAYPRIVFCPMSMWESSGRPDLVLVFARQNQLSALVTMLGFRSGRAVNVIAPFCAACQSIMFASAEAESESPRAVMGLFDISQRKKQFEDYLSLTMTYDMFAQMAQDVETSCLTTSAWKSIEDRQE